MILSRPDDVTIGLREQDDSDREYQMPSFTCVAAGIPAPIMQWAYVPNLDGRGDEISLSADIERYRIVSNVTVRDDGRLQTWTTVTFLDLTVTDGGLVRCRTSSLTTAVSADALLTVIGKLKHFMLKCLRKAENSITLNPFIAHVYIGKPDHIDVLESTRGEFVYDVALPVLLQHPVKLNISYVDQSRQSFSSGILTRMEYNDTKSILYREVDRGQLPFERYFVRISVVAEFGNRRVEGPPITSSEMIGKRP